MMSTIINIVINILVTIIIAYLAYEVVRLKAKVRRATNEFIQATMDKSILYDKLNELVAANNVKNIEKSDGFLKFVSDSRDWAFEYIEKTQHEIKKFSDAVQKDLEYVETYGQALEIEPYSEILKRISVAYKELVTLLPTEEIKEK